MIGNPPWPGIDVEAFFEFADLSKAAEFREGIPASKCPVAAACPAVEFQNADVVSRLAQLDRCRHACESRAEDKHGGALRVAVKFDRTLVGGVGGKPQAGHRMVHRRAA